MLLFSRNAGNGSATALTNGEANDDFNESGLAENNKINRSNSKSVGGGRDASRKGRDGDKKGDKDSGKDPLSLTIKLESDVKRLKCDLQLSRNRENDLRDQIVSYMSSEFGLNLGFNDCLYFLIFRRERTQVGGLKPLG